TPPVQPDDVVTVVQRLAKSCVSRERDERVLVLVVAVRPCGGNDGVFTNQRRATQTERLDGAGHDFAVQVVERTYCAQAARAFAQRAQMLETATRHVPSGDTRDDVLQRAEADGQQQR